MEDPKPFGVVKWTTRGVITEFVEKPQTFVSRIWPSSASTTSPMGNTRRKEMQFLIDNDVKDKGEYQLTNAMENMKRKGALKAGSVDVWMDCGNKNAMVDTNTKVLGHLKGDSGLVSPTMKNDNSVIIAPCFIGENVSITGSIVGPNVSIESGAGSAGAL